MKRAHTLLGIVLLTFSFSSAVEASTVIFSNLGPGDIFSNAGQLISGPTSIFGDQDVGSQFIAQKTAALDFMELALTSDNVTPSLDVWLMSDAGGLPGSIVEAFSLSNVPHVSSCPPVCPVPPLTVATSVLHPTLLAGTQYWIIASTSGNTGSFRLNFTGDIGTVGRVNGGPWIAAPLATASAFRVNGNDISTAVPELASIWLLTLGIAGVLSRAGWGHRKVTKLRR